MAHLCELPFLFSEVTWLLEQSWPREKDAWLHTLTGRLGYDTYPQTLMLLNPLTMKVYGTCCLLSQKEAPKIVNSLRNDSLIWIDSFTIHKDYRNIHLGSLFVSLIESYLISHINKDLSHPLNSDSKQNLRHLLLAQSHGTSDFYQKNNFTRLSHSIDKSHFNFHDSAYIGTTWVKDLLV